MRWDLTSEVSTGWGGLPSELVERARLVSRQLRNNEPIERLEPEPEACFRQRADDLLGLLRRFDAATGHVSAFLQVPPCLAPLLLLSPPPTPSPPSRVVACNVRCRRGAWQCAVRWR